MFEESEGRNHGQCSLLDLARVLEIKKQLCEANVSVFLFCRSLEKSLSSLKNLILRQSVSESHIPDSLLERLITGTTEFPPACAIVGGILAQVLSLTQSFPRTNLVT